MRYCYVLRIYGLIIGLENAARKASECEFQGGVWQCCSVVFFLSMFMIEMSWFLLFERKKVAGTAPRKDMFEIFCLLYIQF
jgi:hypothetical protein